MQFQKVPMSSKNLKQQNQKFLNLYLFTLAILFLWFSSGNSLTIFSFRDVFSHRSGVGIPLVIIGLFIFPLTKLVLMGMIPDSIRDKLIHWRYRHPLPGSRAFSDIATNDSRIDLENLAFTYGNLPIDPKEQNKLFYKIYKSVEDCVGVLHTHRLYLATRDCSSMTFILFFFLTPLIYLTTYNLEKTFYYGLAMVVLFGAFSYAAQNYSIRFVQNALAEGSSK